MEKLNNGLLKQIFLILLITFIGIEIILHLKYFMPGFFGAITLYILFRNWYFKLIEVKHWKKWMASLVLILGCIILVVIPIFSLVKILIPRVSFALSQASFISQKVTDVIDKLKVHFPSLSISNEQIMNGVQQIAVYIPKVLNATASVISNIAVAFFILYFMLMGGREMESKIEEFLPLNSNNRDLLWKETQNLVISNALGIPILALCQGCIAILGYWVFGVKDFVIWGLLTGAASIIPVVGTMLVWVPICIFMFFGPNIGMAVGLTAFCAIVVSNVDNVLRFSLMRKFGNVHPLITVFGVILGLQIFGIMGLIFGPLLISYLLLLLQIYKIEYGKQR